MATETRKITLTELGGNAGPNYSVFYSVDCSTYIQSSDCISVSLPTPGSSVYCTVDTASLCIKLTSLGDCTNSDIEDLRPTTTTTIAPSTTTLSPTTSTTTLVPTTSTTTIEPTTSTTTVEPTTSTTTLVPTTSTTTIEPTTSTTTVEPTTSTTLAPTTSTTLAPTTSTTTTSISRLIRFEYTSSISTSIDVDASFNTDYYDSGSFTSGTVSSGSPILIEDYLNIPLTETFLITSVLNNADNPSESIFFNDIIDVYITDYYDSLAPLSSSYLGLNMSNKFKNQYDVLGYYSSSQWNTLTRKVEIYESTNKDLILYNVSGSNGFDSYNDALTYITGSGSVAHTIGILPVSQSMMQKGWLRVPAFNTDYTTRYTASIDSRRFYVGEFNGNREIVRFEPDTYSTSSNIWVQRLNNKTPFEAERETINNFGNPVGWPTLCGGGGTATVDMYYNQESGSLYNYVSSAAWWAQLSYVNQIAYGTEPFKNTTLTTGFVSGDAFVVRYTLDYDFLQGDLNPNNLYMKYAYMTAGKFVSTPTWLGSALRCS